MNSNQFQICYLHTTILPHLWNEMVCLVFNWHLCVMFVKLYYSVYKKAQCNFGNEGVMFIIRDLLTQLLRKSSQKSNVFKNLYNSAIQIDQPLDSLI